MKRIIKVICFLTVVLILVSCNKKNKATIESQDNIIETTEITIADTPKTTIEEITEGYEISDHIEDWRINDINSYKYLIETILDNFEYYDRGVFDERFWFTDNFRNTYNFDDYNINFSMDETVTNNEWYAIRLMDDPFYENTKETLLNNEIMFYTIEKIDNEDRYLNKYTFIFTTDDDNKLDTLVLSSKKAVRQYQEEANFYNQMFYDIVKQVNIDKNSDIRNYKKYFTENCFNELHSKNFFNVCEDDDTMIELKIRKLVSKNGKVIFNAMLSGNSENKYIVFAYYYENLDDKVSVCKDYDNNRIEFLTKDEYDMPDKIEEETW